MQLEIKINKKYKIIHMENIPRNTEYLQDIEEFIKRILGINELASEKAPVKAVPNLEKNKALRDMAYILAQRFNAPYSHITHDPENGRKRFFYDWETVDNIVQILLKLNERQIKALSEKLKEGNLATEQN